MTCEEREGCRCIKCATRMTRRWFLGAAGVLLAAPTLAEGLDLNERNVEAVAASLPPGWNVARRGTGVYTVHHNIMTAAQFREAVQRQLNDVYGEIYDRHAVEWHAMYSGRVMP